MKKQTLTTLLFFLIFVGLAKAQFSIYAQTGISYIEHFSAGITCSFTEKHHISLLYGSNLFIKPKNFSSYLVQYYLTLNKMKLVGITPAIGIKGGHAIYSDDYYKWQVVPIIPFIGLHYPINKKFEIMIALGAAFSLEQTAERISFGEIGKYRELLPEIKTGIHYRLK